MNKSTLGAGPGGYGPDQSQPWSPPSGWSYGGRLRGWERRAFPEVSLGGGGNGNVLKAEWTPLPRAEAVVDW